MNIESSEINNNTNVTKQLNGLLTSARQYVQILHVFERFPHRNASLGRRNTDEEDEYLTTNVLPTRQDPYNKDLNTPHD
jgi:uncharacterized protein (DUF924 family)